jgi:hypothetical protein
MLKIEDPGSSFLLYLGPGPPSLLHLTRADPIYPYAGDTQLFVLSWTREPCYETVMSWIINVFTSYYVRAGCPICLFASVEGEGVVFRYVLAPGLLRRFHYG